MIKKSLFSALLIVIGLNVQAQSYHSFVMKLIPTAKQKQVRNMLRFVQRQNSLVLLQKTTILKQRVIAQTTEQDGDKDSTAFKYSGLRGSEYNFNDVGDLSYRGYLDDYYYADDYISGQPSDMQADTISYFETNGSPSFELSEQYIGHYRNDNQMDTMNYYIYNSGAVSFADKYIRVYNNQGHLTDVYQLSYNAMIGTTYDTTGRQKIAYNNDFSQVLSDTTWSKSGNSWRFMEATQYLYNNNDKLIKIKSLNYNQGSLSFEPYENTIIQYNGNGKVRSVSVYEADMPVSIGLESRDSFLYTPGVAYYTGWYEENWDAGSFDYGIHMVQFPGTNGLPDSLKAYDKNSLNQPYTLEGSLYYTFNSFNNPVKEFIQFPDSPMDTAVARFYYETYNDATAIQNPANSANKLTTFPNPFSQTIYIKWQSDELRHAVLKLYDFSGRQVFQKKINIHSGSNLVNVPHNLPSGLYQLQLRDAEGNQWYQKMIKK